MLDDAERVWHTRRTMTRSSRPNHETLSFLQLGLARSAARDFEKALIERVACDSSPSARAARAAPSRSLVPRRMLERRFGGLQVAMDHGVPIAEPRVDMRRHVERVWIARSGSVVLAISSERFARESTLEQFHRRFAFLSRSDDVEAQSTECARFRIDFAF